MSGQLRQIVESVLLVFAALLPIVNPFGGAPVFLAMTADITPEVRKTLATQVAINAFVLLFASVFVGIYVLEFFGLSVPIVQVAGGLTVCGLGWDLLRQEKTVPEIIPAVGPGPSEIATRAFYPLTLPLTVGPGSISVAITIGANHSHGIRSLLVSGISELIGVTLIAATILVCYRYADRMVHVLGATGTSVLVRLSAFILLCIGVQIFWNGASALFESVPALRGR
jgi:multiple antibiotic resistance protein